MATFENDLDKLGSKFLDICKYIRSLLLLAIWGIRMYRDFYKLVFHYWANTNSIFALKFFTRFIFN